MHRCTSLVETFPNAEDITSPPFKLQAVAEKFLIDKPNDTFSPTVTDYLLYNDL